MSTRYFSAPGRTEIGGNHTDHQRGRVLAAAVNLDTRAAVALNGTNTICVCSEGFVPNEKLDAFRTGIDAVLGSGTCLVLQIRPEGGVELQSE